MTSAEIIPRQAARVIGRNTYGCLQPEEITGLDALIDDIKRTQAHILWLEEYIAQLSTEEVFTDQSWDFQKAQEEAKIGRPTIVGSVAWKMQMNRKALQQTKHVRRATHPAVTTLLNERKHLADVSHKAITIGIKLDDIDYSRKQADLIIAGMARFAIDSGMDANDPTVAQRITAALETVLNSVG